MSQATPNQPQAQVIRLAKPATGTTQAVASQPGAQIQLEFPEGQATFSRSGNDLSVAVDGGGNVTLTNFFVVGNQSLPTLKLADGTEVASADFLAAQNPNMDLATAAGPGAGAPGSGGEGSYADDPGALLGGIDKLGSLGTVFWDRATEAPEIIRGPLADTGAPGLAPGISIVPLDPNDPRFPENPEHPTDNPAARMEGGRLIVDEAYLEGGTKEGRGTPSATVAFLITVTNDTLGSITINGTTYNVVSDGAGALTLEGFGAASVECGHGHLANARVVANGDGTYTLTFDYTLDHSSREHAADNARDIVADDDWTAAVSAQGASGVSTDPVGFKVDIQDDIPFIEVVSGAETGLDGTNWQNPSADDDVVNNMVDGGTTSGAISFKAGADGLADGTKDFNGDGVNEQGLSVSFKAADGTVTTAAIHLDGTATAIDGEHGSLKIWYENDRLQYEFTAKGGADGNPDTFTFTITDRDGDRYSDTLTLGVQKLVDFNFGDGLKVDESFLGGIDPNTGLPIPNEHGVMGTMAGQDDARLSDGGEFTLTAEQLAVFSVNGQDIHGEGPHTVTTDHGHMEITVTPDGNGGYTVSYEYTLEKNWAEHPDNAAHPGGGRPYHGYPEGTAPAGTYDDWDEAAKPDCEEFTFKVGNQEQVLQITIEDDGLGEPGKMGNTVTFEEVQAEYNIALCIDISGSMLWNRGSESAAEDYADTRIYAQQVAMLHMLREYANQAGADNVHVTMSFFGRGEALDSTKTMTYAEAVKLIQGLTSKYQVSLDENGDGVITKDNHNSDYTPNGGTNYTAACDAFAEVVEMLLAQDPQVRAYFFSDGNPDPAGQTADKSDAWMELLRNLTPEQLEHFNLYTVGIAGSATDLGEALKAVLGALSGDAEHTAGVYIPENAPVSFYVDTLIDTVGLNGRVELPIAADGVLNGKAFLQNVVYVDTKGVSHGGDLVGVDEKGFPKAADGTIDTESVAVDVPYGKIIFHVDGTYTFQPSPDLLKNLPAGGDTMKFSLTFMDADGDAIMREFSFKIEGPLVPITLGIEGAGDELNVFEHDLVASAVAVSKETGDDASLQIKVDPRAELESVDVGYKFDGKDFTLTLNPGDTDKALELPGGIGKVVFTLGVDGKLSYHVELYAPENNVAPGDTAVVNGNYTIADTPADLDLSITAHDSKGNTASGALTVNIHDDEPVAAPTDAHYENVAGIEVRGLLGEIGADDSAGSKMEFTNIDGAKCPWLYDGKAVTLEYGNDEHSIVIGKGHDGTPVFTVTIDAASGEYVFKQLVSLDTEVSKTTTIGYGSMQEKLPGDHKGGVWIDDTGDKQGGILTKEPADGTWALKIDAYSGGSEVPVNGNTPTFGANGGKIGTGATNYMLLTPFTDLSTDTYATEMRIGILGNNGSLPANNSTWAVVTYIPVGGGAPVTAGFYNTGTGINVPTKPGYYIENAKVYTNDGHVGISGAGTSQTTTVTEAVALEGLKLDYLITDADLDIAAGTIAFIPHVDGDISAAHLTVDADHTGYALAGGDGGHTLTGSDGHDVISGGAGHDLIGGGHGNDTIHAGTGDDLVFAGDVHYKGLDGAEALDLLHHDAGVAGRDLHTYLAGHIADLGGGTAAADGHNLVDGGTGNDLLVGGGGSDTIHGGDGNDTIFGGAGDDLIFGGKGDDVMYGGGGADTFAWHVTDLGGNDTIMDFELGKDKLSFQDLFGDQTPGALAEQISKALGERHIDVAKSDDTHLTVTVNLDGTQEQRVEIALHDSNARQYDLNTDDGKAALLQDLLTNFGG